MVQTLYLLRHGQTIWNRERRLQGALDSPLTLRGVEQARRMGETLGRQLVNPAAYALYVSPAGRALQTAAIVCDVLGLDYGACRVDERLRELSWGDWDGLTKYEIERHAPGELARRERHIWEYAPPGGESYGHVAARVQAWRAEVAGERRLIVIAHGTLGRVLRGLHLGLSPSEMLAQEAPQDGLFRLHDDGLELIRTTDTELADSCPTD